MKKYPKAISMIKEILKLMLKPTVCKYGLKMPTHVSLHIII